MIYNVAFVPWIAGDLFLRNRSSCRAGRLAELLRPLDLDVLVLNETMNFEATQALPSLRGSGSPPGSESRRHPGSCVGHDVNPVRSRRDASTWRARRAAPGPRPVGRSRRVRAT